MRTSKIAVRCRPVRLMASIGAVAGMMGATDAGAAYTEFESFHLAVVSRDKQAALTFIDAFPASHFVDDLFVMLPREIGQAVCADLRSSSPRAQDACRKPAMSPGAREFVESGVGDAAPAAGPNARGQEPADARSRPGRAAGARTAGSIARLLLPSATDNPAAPADKNRTTQTARQDAEAAPRARREAPAPAPGLGSDPGSDPGTTSSPSSHGGDPGSDPGSGSGGGSGARDSHN